MVPALLLIAATIGTESTVEDVIGWLPTDTETVVAVTKPGRFDEEERKSTLPGVARSIAALGLAGDFRHLSYRFIVDGSRNSHKPKGFGLGPYEGCKILSLEPSEAKRLNAIVTDRHLKTQIVGGIRASLITVHQEHEDLTSYLAFVDGFLLSATDPGYLSQVLTRRSGHSKGRALPPSLAEWSLVDKRAPLWAVRHLRANSSLGVGAESLGDEKLTGIALVLDRSLRRLDVFSISGSPDGLDKARLSWIGSSPRERVPGLISIESFRPHVTRISLDPKAEDPAFVELTAVLAVLGHPLFV